MHSRRREFVRANGRVGQVHRHFAPRAFPLGRPGLRMSAAVILQYRNPVAEATPRKNYWKRGRGLCEGGLRRHAQRRQRHTQTTIHTEALKTPNHHCEEEPDAGGRIPFSPQMERCPKPESPQAILARNSTAPRHLGASSPSGNARGGCRG